jgi:hypothetical protein
MSVVYQTVQDLLSQLAASKGEASGEGDAAAAAPAPDSVAATQKIVDTLQVGKPSLNELYDLYGV